MQIDIVTAAASTVKHLLAAATAQLVLFSPCGSVCVSSWRNVVLETLSVVGTTAETASLMFQTRPA